MPFGHKTWQWHGPRQNVWRRPFKQRNGRTSDQLISSFALRNDLLCVWEGLSGHIWKLPSTFDLPDMTCRFFARMDL